MVKLDRLINVLGGYGVRLIAPPRSRDVELRSVVMHDPAGARGAVGEVFLAVGVHSPVQAVELAATAHSLVVLVHEEGEPEGEVIAAAAERGIAVLLVDRAVSWSQLCAIVYGLVLEGRETESGRGPSDLFALADTIAAAVGGPVTIVDRHWRVVAYSGKQADADRVRLETILGRRVPDEVRALFDRLDVSGHLAASDEPLFVQPSPEHGLHGRMVVAVRAGRELLGSLWVQCDEPLAARRARVFADGAHTVALHMLRSRVSADLERQVESELVIGLLEGTPEATTSIGKLGLPPDRFRVLALQAHSYGERHGAILLAFERSTTGFGWSRPGRSTLFGNTVYTLLPGDDDPAAARDWLDDLTSGLPAHVSVTSGIGGVADLYSIPASRHEADECLALHASNPDRPPVSYDESWDEILLQRLRTAAAAGRSPVRGPIADLAQHDDRHNTHYVSTLRAWLEALGDPAAAAALLDVHPNTVRYRIRKASELVTLALDDPRKRLAMLITLAAQEPSRPGTLPG